MTEHVRTSRELIYGIVGTGAIGGYYGGRLAEADKEVHFLLHSDYEYVRDHGLRVDSVKGDFTIAHPHAYASSREMPQCDVVIVAIKTTANHLLPSLLSPLMKDGTTVVLIQNGLGMEQALASQFPRQHIVGGMAFICSNKVGPGHIVHLDQGRLVLGSYESSVPPMVPTISADFADAGIDMKWADDLNAARWRKLLCSLWGLSLQTVRIPHLP